MNLLCPNCQKMLTIPDQYRVDGVVRNVDPWYAAFSVKPDEKLFLAPDQRVHIW